MFDVHRTSRIIDTIIRTLHLNTIIPFGSRVRGGAREDSDFDICMSKTGISERCTKARTLYRPLYGVGAPVELIVDTLATLWKFRINPHLIYREIAWEGKVHVCQTK